MKRIVSSTGALIRLLVFGLALGGGPLSCTSSPADGDLEADAAGNDASKTGDASTDAITADALLRRDAQTRDARELSLDSSVRPESSPDDAVAPKVDVSLSGDGALSDRSTDESVDVASPRDSIAETGAPESGLERDDGMGAPDGRIPLADSEPQPDAPDSGPQQDPLESASCGCPSGTKLCGDRCVAIDDPTYGCSPLGCGTCVGAPGVAQVQCLNGSCAPMGCTAPSATCNSSLCGAFLNTPAACGACGTVCATGQVCTTGRCNDSCAPPLTNCSGACEDLPNSANNCGVCGNVCPHLGELGYDVACRAGRCITACTGGRAACGSACVDTTSDPSNCGACGTSCPRLQGGDPARCIAGECVMACPSGLTRCGDSCVATTYDDANCGTCGHGCGADVCQAGECTAVTSTVVVSNLSTPKFLMLDGEYVYWAEGAPERIARVLKSGGAAQTVVPDSLVRGTMATDESYIYWASHYDHAIMRARKDGTGTPVLIAHEPWPYNVAVDGSNVYWSRMDADATVSMGTVMKQDKTGAGTAEALSPVVLTRGIPIVRVSDGIVYWRVAGALYHQPVTGGPPTQVRVFYSPGFPYQVAPTVIDPPYVYYDHYPYPDGTMITALDGSRVQGARFTEFSVSPTQIVGNYIYGNLGGIVKIARCGGGVQMIRPGTISTFAVDAQDVYWADGSTIRRVRN